MGSVGSWTEVNAKSVKKTWGNRECKGSLNDVAALSDPGTAGHKNSRQMLHAESCADVGKTYKVKHLQKFLKQRRHHWQRLIG